MTHQDIFTNIPLDFECPICGRDSNDVKHVPVADDDAHVYGRDAYQDDDGSWFIDVDCCGVIL